MDSLTTLFVRPGMKNRLREHARSVLDLPDAPATADGKTGVSTIVSARKKLTARAVTLNLAGEPTRESRVLIKFGRDLRDD